MKKTLILTLALVLTAGVVGADTLTVDATSAQLGSNFGLNVNHVSGTPIAFVQDNTPNEETIYRGSFIFELGSVNVEPTGSFRNAIMTSLGAVPRPGEFNCSSTLAFIETIRIFMGYSFFGGVGQPWIQARGRGDGCGEVGTGQVFFINQEDTNGNGAVNVCFQYTAGNAGPPVQLGRIEIGVFDDTEACDLSGFRGTDVNNLRTSVLFTRLGTPQANAFNVGEDMDLYFDNFASFRTTLN
ncbi:MAG: hypothetical protein AAF658_15005 [Myxococcota bacterium]